MGLYLGGRRHTKTNKYIIDEVVVKCYGEKALARKATHSNKTAYSVHHGNPACL